MPKLDDTPLPELKRPTAVPVAQTTKKPEEVKKTEPVQEKPKVVEQKKSTPAPTPAPVKMQDSADHQDLINVIQTIKDRANAVFKTADYGAAVKIYTEAIKMYDIKKRPRTPELDVLIG